MTVARTVSSFRTVGLRNCLRRYGPVVALQVRRVVLLVLFGTLVPGGTGEQRDLVAHAVASDLGVDPDDLAALFRATFDDRATGRLGDLTSSMIELASRLGSHPGALAIERAVQRRLNLNRSLFQASWALPVLDRLRAVGVPIGVVSDCSAETPAVLARSPLAARVDTTSFLPAGCPQTRSGHLSGRGRRAQHAPGAMPLCGRRGQQRTQRRTRRRHASNLVSAALEN